MPSYLRAPTWFQLTHVRPAPTENEFNGNAVKQCRFSIVVAFSACTPCESSTYQYHSVHTHNISRRLRAVAASPPLSFRNYDLCFRSSAARTALCTTHTFNCAHMVWQHCNITHSPDRRRRDPFVRPMSYVNHFSLRTINLFRNESISFRSVVHSISCADYLFQYGIREVAGMEAKRPKSVARN